MEARKRFLLVTNNAKAYAQHNDDAHLGVEYLEGQSFFDVLIRTRDLIHAGWHLITHPQASNLKPNQTPYKTIMVSRDYAAESLERDIDLIESAIAAYGKLTSGMVRKPSWTQKALNDFQTVDLAVIDSALQGSLLQQKMMM